MPGPLACYVNGVEMLNEHGIEWSMTFEEVLGSTGRAKLVLQDRTRTLLPKAHWDVRVVIRSSGWILFRGEVLNPSFKLSPGEPWIRWDLDCVDYNDQLPQRKVGAFDGKTWIDTSGLGIYVNIDPYATTLATDKLTVQALFDHYVRINGQAIETSTYVGEYVTEIFPVEWAYSDVQAALEDLAALVVDNLQFWIDPDLKFHWTVIPAWQDLLQDGSVVGADETESMSAMMFAEGVTDLPYAPYEIIDANVGEGQIGFSNLSVQYDGSSMPEQVYVKGGTGYVYNAPALGPTSETKTVVHNPTAGAADRYQISFIQNTKLWHTDSTGYVSTSYDWAAAGSGPYECKWVTVPWNEARNKGGHYWKILEGPYKGKLADDNTNTLNGYGKQLVEKVVVTPPSEPQIGIGGTGWVLDVAQDNNKRQAYLEAPISTTRSKRDSLGGQALYRGQFATLRGSVEVYGLDGWRVGQIIKIADARIPDELNGRYFVVQSVKASVIEGTDLRHYVLDFGDGPESRWSMKAQQGDITWPPPFAYIEIKVFDLSPGPNSSQRITGQLVAPDGTPWSIAGKTVNWSVECYNSAGVKQVGVGKVDPKVSITNKNGRAFTTLTTGAGTGLVYYVFADVKAV